MGRKGGIGRQIREEAGIENLCEETGAAKHSQNSAVMGCPESRTREVTETLLCLEVGTNVHTLTY